MRIEKPDADEIRAFVRELPQNPVLGVAQRRWPQYIWHYSDIRNVAEILRSGRIYSRQRLKQLGKVSVEIAHLPIIDQSPWAHPYVRLYFRPVTPTQYHIEGIRAGCREDRRPHCPVPVFLLFDSASLLTRSGCWFTNSNLARADWEMGNDVEFLRSRMDFSRIYHDAPLPQNDLERRRIIGARCAEVLFRDELDLDDLREVACRTTGERTTLLSLLGDAAVAWRQRITVVQAVERMFFRDNAYVQEARLLEREILVEFGGHTSAGHTFSAQVWLLSGESLRYQGQLPGTRLRLALPGPQPRVRLHLDLCGCLAYQGVVAAGGLLAS